MNHDLSKPEYSISDFARLLSGSPMVTVKEFSKRSGMPIQSVYKAVQRGHLPVVRTGGRAIFINMALLTAHCFGYVLNPAQVPSSSPASRHSPPRPGQRKKSKRRH